MIRLSFPGAAASLSFTLERHRGATAYGFYDFMLRVTATAFCSILDSAPEYRDLVECQSTAVDLAARARDDNSPFDWLNNRDKRTRRHDSIQLGTIA